MLSLFCTVSIVLVDFDDYWEMSQISFYILEALKPRLNLPYIMLEGQQQFNQGWRFKVFHCKSHLFTFFYQSIFDICCICLCLCMWCFLSLLTHYWSGLCNLLTTCWQWFLRKGFTEILMGLLDGHKFETFVCLFQLLQHSVK